MTFGLLNFFNAEETKIPATKASTANKWSSELWSTITSFCYFPSKIDAMKLHHVEINNLKQNLKDHHWSNNPNWPSNKMRYTNINRSILCKYKFANNPITQPSSSNHKKHKRKYCQLHHINTKCKHDMEEIIMHRKVSLIPKVKAVLFMRCKNYFKINI